MQEALTNISEHSSESLVEIGNFMQSLDEEDTGWAMLQAKFHQFGKNLLQSRNMLFHFETNIAEELDKPDPVTYMNLLQIYKEALTNTVKHSRATSVQVDLTIHTEDLRLSIHDNGIGYRIEIVHGKGLANIKARAQKIGGTLSITSSQGTVVALELPLK